MVQLEEFLSGFLQPLLKSGLPSMKNILKPYAKSLLIPLGSQQQHQQQTQEYIKVSGQGARLGTLTRVANVYDRLRSSDLAKRTTLIISNEEMDDVMRIVKSLESGLLKKGVSE